MNWWLESKLIDIVPHVKAQFSGSTRGNGKYERELETGYQKASIVILHTRNMKIYLHNVLN